MCEIFGQDEVIFANTGRAMQEISKECNPITPDQTFCNFRASESVDRLNLCIKETLPDGF